MAINFEAANMAGYNNPEVHMLRVSTSAETGEILYAPRVSDINNIVKSGVVPAVCLTGGGYTFVLPLACISADGDYVFSNIYLSNDGSFTPTVSTLVFSQNSDTPTLVSKTLQEASA